MGIFKETLVEFFDRKQHFLFAVLVGVALVGIYLGISEKTEMVRSGVGSFTTLQQLASNSLNTIMSVLVLISVVATAILFPRLVFKGRVEFYLSKPVTRKSILYRKIISIGLVYGVVILVSGFAVSLQLFLLGALPLAKTFYIPIVHFVIFLVWISITSWTGLMTGSAVVSFFTAAFVWAGQLLLMNRTSWSIEEPILRYLVDGSYHFLPNTSEMARIGVQFTSGAAVSGWLLPFATSIVLAGILLYMGGRLFQRRDF